MKTNKERSYRVRFSEKQIDAVLRVAGITDNNNLGQDAIAHFGYIVSKLYKIKEDWINKKNGA